LTACQPNIFLAGMYQLQLINADNGLTSPSTTTAKAIAVLMSESLWLDWNLVKLGTF
jgi:hypothetical protein